MLPRGCSSSLTALWPLCRLGLAYAGSNREDVLTLLLPVMGDSKSSMEVGAEAGFSCDRRCPAASLSSKSKATCPCSVLCCARRA